MESRTPISTFSVSLDEQFHQRLGRQAVGFMATSTKVMVGAAGGAVGGIVAGRDARNKFLSNLIAGPGNYSVVIDDAGISIGTDSYQSGEMRWLDIEAWSLSKDFAIMLKSRQGATLALPLQQMRSQDADLVVDVLKGLPNANKYMSDSHDKKPWNERSTADKVVLGLLFGLLALAILFGLFVAVLIAGGA